MLDLFEPFDMKYNVPDNNRPGGISGHLSILEAGNSIVSEFLSDKEDNPKDDVIYQRLNKVKVS